MDISFYMSTLRSYSAPQNSQGDRRGKASDHRPCKGQEVGISKELMDAISSERQNAASVASPRPHPLFTGLSIKLVSTWPKEHQAAAHIKFSVIFSSSALQKHFTNGL